MYKNTYDENDYSSTSYGSGGMKKSVHKVMEALEGEVELKPRRANITAYKHNLLHNELSSIGVREVFNRIDSNSDNSVYFSTKETKFVFYPHLNIK